VRLSKQTRRLRRYFPGTRTFAVMVGAFFGGWYALDPPIRHDDSWPSAAAAVIATLLVALAVAEPFKAETIKRARDAWPASAILLMSVVSLLLAVRNAAYGTAFPVAAGAIVIGSLSALGWLTLTGVFDALIRRALNLPARNDAISARDTSTPTE
jgi:uncharacterized membrane protein YhaH (DUF805 family)